MKEAAWAVTHSGGQRPPQMGNACNELLYDQATLLWETTAIWNLLAKLMAILVNYVSLVGACVFLSSTVSLATGIHFSIHSLNEYIFECTLHAA